MSAVQRVCRSGPAIQEHAGRTVSPFLRASPAPGLTSPCARARPAVPFRNHLHASSNQHARQSTGALSDLASATTPPAGRLDSAWGPARLRSAAHRRQIPRVPASVTGVWSRSIPTATKRPLPQAKSFSGIESGRLMGRFPAVVGGAVHDRTEATPIATLRQATENGVPRL